MQFEAQAVVETSWFGWSDVRDVQPTAKMAFCKSVGITLNSSHFYMVVSEQKQYAGFVRLRAWHVVNASSNKMVTALGLNQKKLPPRHEGAPPRK